VTWCRLTDGTPSPKHKGENFRSFTNALRHLGYQVEWRELRACDYGAPTIRKRFFLIARRDGRPIVWPKPTHSKTGAPLKPWRTAAEIIDWSIPTMLLAFYRF
jgi:DNA (cytosine-5)-methyltransferase 1